MADHNFLNPLSTKLDAAQVVRRSYDEDANRIRVDAEVTATIGTVDVIIDASTGDNIAIADQTGANYLDVQSDGSINVNVVSLGQINTNIFNEVTGIVSGVTTTILNHTITSNGKLVSVDFAGTNVAMYSLYVNGSLAAKKYTFWGSLNGRFDLDLNVYTSDSIELEVIHMRPNVGDFNSNFIIGS